MSEDGYYNIYHWNAVVFFYKSQNEYPIGIYTREGDKRKTGIHSGERVDEDDIRIETSGMLDELSIETGTVRTLLPPDHEQQVLLDRIQHEMVAVMSHVATSSVIRDQNPNSLPDDLTVFCKPRIDDLSAQMEDSGYLILSGCTPVLAHPQPARTITRRVECRLWTLDRKSPVPAGIMAFVNRLSDLLFTMARYDMFHQGNIKERWQSLLYKWKNES